MENHSRKHYAHRDMLAQGDVYFDHLRAMSAEGLKNPYDIAAELAHREILIADLLAMVRRYAAECSTCGGAGYRIHFGTCEYSDCNGCAEIRQLIARAEGR